MHDLSAVEVLILGVNLLPVQAASIHVFKISVSACFSLTCAEASQLSRSIASSINTLHDQVCGARGSSPEF